MRINRDEEYRSTEAVDNDNILLLANRVEQFVISISHN